MIRRALLVLVLAASALPALPLVSASAAAGPLGAVAGRQDTFTHRLIVTGWAYDAGRSAASIEVQVYVDGHYAGRVRADRSSPRLDERRHIGGRHAFRLVRTWLPRAGAVTLVGHTVSGVGVRLDRAAAAHFVPGPGARVVIVAKRYVGKARYVEGGASPRGFDCSGYTRYAYAVARVRTLPHSAEGQRTMPGMRRLSRAAARPGDLVFYLAGGGAYHVAIYAGHGMQYAAATPRDGIRYQRVWSSNVQYRSIWH